MQPWFTVYFFDTGHKRYDQLTPVKTRYPLTSIGGSSLQLIEVKCWFFDWIEGSCLVNLLKTGQDCSEAG